MSTKNNLVLGTLALLICSPGFLMSVAAQGKNRPPSVKERAFQIAVAERTYPPFFGAQVTDLKRIERLLAGPIRMKIKSDALSRAAGTGDVGLLKLLLNHGADVNHVYWGQTVLMLAAAQGFYVQCGNDPMVTSYRGNVDEVTSLIAAGARLNDRDNDGNTALMLAAQNGRSDSVRLLLCGGADVHLKNAQGWTALIFAANSSGNFDQGNLTSMVEALIAGGADLNERDGQCKTALTYAARSSAIASMLIRAGAIE